MSNEIISHTPIVMDNGEVVEARIVRQPSGMYAVEIDYKYKANTNSTRVRQIVDALWRNQHQSWFRFIRFQKSSTPLPMPPINKTTQ